MDPAEDVLVLYSTSHGAPVGLTYHDGDSGYGILSPSRLGVVLGELGIKRRILLLSACYSGIFIPLLASDDTVMATAASADRPSFGCQADNDWTFFGDALINNALRKPHGLAEAATEARQSISQWEASRGFEPSQPQFFAGRATARWLSQLEARMPREPSGPIGTPAVASLGAVAAGR
jgi:hypothetical protein